MCYSKSYRTDLQDLLGKDSMPPVNQCLKQQGTFLPNTCLLIIFSIRCLRYFYIQQYLTTKCSANIRYVSHLIRLTITTAHFICTIIPILQRIKLPLRNCLFLAFPLPQLQEENVHIMTLSTFP